MSKAHALSIFRAGLKAADPARAIRRHVRLEGDTLLAGRHRYRLAAIRNIYVLGAGKAGAAMSAAIERLLGRRITRGLVNVRHDCKERGRRIELHPSGHPIPDAAGFAGARRIAGLAREAHPDDLVICLISGGASALMPLPAPGIAPGDKRRLTELLLACGANIHEMNCLRKHLSAVKGGQLARLAYPARVLTLILSDVVGDDLDVIGSGSTVPDRSTFGDAAHVLTAYDLWDKVPSSVAQHIREGCEETPKPGDPIFDRVQNLIVGSNRLAAEAAVQRARELGYRTLLLSTMIQGEARDVARVHAAIALETIASANPVKPPACIISGGETTVTMRGHGLGGRNQEFALAAALDIRNSRRITILSAGTDGSDGPTDAAGAIASNTTLDRAEKLGLRAAEFLANNDSYHFFEPLGDLVKTGPTHTNVADLRVILIQ